MTGPVAVQEDGAQGVDGGYVGVHEAEQRRAVGRVGGDALVADEEKVRGDVEGGALVDALAVAVQGGDLDVGGAVTDDAAAVEDGRVGAGADVNGRPGGLEDAEGAGGAGAGGEESVGDNGGASRTCRLG